MLPLVSLMFGTSVSWTLPEGISYSLKTGNTGMGAFCVVALKITNGFL